MASSGEKPPPAQPERADDEDRRLTAELASLSITSTPAAATSTPAAATSTPAAASPFARRSAFDASAAAPGSGSRLGVAGRRMLAAAARQLHHDPLHRVTVDAFAVADYERRMQNKEAFDASYSTSAHTKTEATPRPSFSPLTTPPKPTPASRGASQPREGPTGWDDQTEATLVDASSDHTVPAGAASPPSLLSSSSSSSSSYSTSRLPASSLLPSAFDSDDEDGVIEVYDPRGTFSNVRAPPEESNAAIPTPSTSTASSSTSSSSFRARSTTTPAGAATPAGSTRPPGTPGFSPFAGRKPARDAGAPAPSEADLVDKWERGRVQEEPRRRAPPSSADRLPATTSKHAIQPSPPSSSTLADQTPSWRSSRPLAPPPSATSAADLPPPPPPSSSSSSSSVPKSVAVQVRSLLNKATLERVDYFGEKLATALFSSTQLADLDAALAMVLDHVAAHRSFTLYAALLGRVAAANPDHTFTNVPVATADAATEPATTPAAAAAIPAPAPAPTTVSTTLKRRLCGKLQVWFTGVLQELAAAPATNSASSSATATTATAAATATSAAADDGGEDGDEIVEGGGEREGAEARGSSMEDEMEAALAAAAAESQAEIEHQRRLRRVTQFIGNLYLEEVIPAAIVVAVLHLLTQHKHENAIMAAMDLFAVTRQRLAALKVPDLDRVRNTFRTLSKDTTITMRARFLLQDMLAPVRKARR